jgi:hypothetical protein
MHFIGGLYIVDISLAPVNVRSITTKDYADDIVEYMTTTISHEKIE